MNFILLKKIAILEEIGSKLGDDKQFRGQGNEKFFQSILAKQIFTDGQHEFYLLKKNCDFRRHRL